MPFDTPISRQARTTWLGHRKTLVLDDVRGSVISVDYGCVWITMEHDPRDIVLLPGMRFEIDRDGRTVVTAEEDSRLRIAHAPTKIEQVLASLTRAWPWQEHGDADVEPDAKPGANLCASSACACSTRSTDSEAERGRSPVPYY